MGFYTDLSYTVEEQLVCKMCCDILCCTYDVVYIPHKSDTHLILIQSYRLGLINNFTSREVSVQRHKYGP